MSTIATKYFELMGHINRAKDEMDLIQSLLNRPAPLSSEEGIHDPMEIYRGTGPFRSGLCSSSFSARRNPTPCYERSSLFP